MKTVREYKKSPNKPEFSIVDFPQIGHNRPPEDEHEQVVVQPWRSVLDDLNRIPAKFILHQQNNEELKDCCRKPENLKYEYRKTRAEFTRPDLFVMQCGCGCNHYRLGVDGPRDKS